MGSEMCIRDRSGRLRPSSRATACDFDHAPEFSTGATARVNQQLPLSPSRCERFAYHIQQNRFGRTRFDARLRNRPRARLPSPRQEAAAAAIARMDRRRVGSGQGFEVRVLAGFSACFRCVDGFNRINPTPPKMAGSGVLHFVEASKVIRVRFGHPAQHYSRSTAVTPQSQHHSHKTTVSAPRIVQHCRSHTRRNTR